MKKNVETVLSELRHDPRFISCVTAWHHFPSTPGEYAEISSQLHPSLKKSLEKKGILSLYTHQKEAYDRVSNGENVCVVTPTASGKTMCYNLPVLDDILKDPNTRALYIFPTKALAQDQQAEIEDICRNGEFSVKSFTFDGDTPTQKRRLAKQVGQIIITNPDMCHQAILPHHTTWARLFKSLKYVVIDEMHNYRGVFGSHVANVLRRLMRICEFYGSSPQFILASATIANPRELAEILTGKAVAVIDQSGAPVSDKDFIFCNPPVVDPDKSTRQSSIDVAYRIASRFIKNDIQTLVFARSRMSCELLVQYLRDSYYDEFERNKIQGYRGGYLPNERRAIEKGIREGSIIGVAATNALELGIDIGRLDVVVMSGYPGTIASTWQQAGRAGRRQGKSAAFLVAGASPLDQFMVMNPEYFFAQTPEYALINPDNPYILSQHVKCAAYELPFNDTPESLLGFGGVHIEYILDHLVEEKILYKSGSRWNWSSTSFPAASISLRSASNDNFVVIDTTKGAEVIGEVDWASAPMLIHEGAIYMHQGRQYHVNKLDYPSRKAYVKEVNVDYYTDANLAVAVRVISTDRVREDLLLLPKLGDLSVTGVSTIYKKIKLYTNENVGSGEISIPDMNMHTQGMWFSIPESICKGIDLRLMGGLLSGLANVILNIAPLFLMSDKNDLGVAVEVRSTYDGTPTIYLYDSYPGGVGLAEKAFEVLPYILKACFELVSACPCSDGCPGCVGPKEEIGSGVKSLCLKVLSGILEGVEM